MRKGTIYVVFIIAFMFLSACGRQKLMSDEDFVNIFRDIYLVNTYTSLNELNCDSLDIYTPVLEKYGYDKDDFAAKLSSFARRKSMRLSSVINEAEREISDSREILKRLLDMENMVNDDAVDRTMRTLYTDTLINVDRLADTMKLKLSVPAKRGNYQVKFNYFIEMPDARTFFAIGEVIDRENKDVLQTYRSLLMCNLDRDVNMNIYLNKDYDDADLDICLVDLSDIKGQMPSITLKNVTVDYKLFTEDAKKKLTDSLYIYKPYIKITSDYEAMQGKYPIAEK